MTLYATFGFKARAIFYSLSIDELRKFLNSLVACLRNGDYCSSMSKVKFSIFCLKRFSIVLIAVSSNGPVFCKMSSFELTETSITSLSWGVGFLSASSLKLSGSQLSMIWMPLKKSSETSPSYKGRSAFASCSFEIKCNGIVSSIYICLGLSLNMGYVLVLL